MRIILFLVGFYLISKLIRHYVLPLLLKKGVERMQQKQQNASANFKEKAKQEEGKVTIKRTQQESTPSNKADLNDGEYVDFEELK
ncbi:DUF4834 family protein [Carboxylicivirga sp. N1Y90]|uniref:DUF4834 family protein n=1 Tax=Carboxylicivirga fragile TaxID=3417571 RepID=UPI003D352ADC|nr:DUF4834 family protein [Marinilabiliaceae bacterium N1Y90]